MTGLYENKKCYSVQKKLHSNSSLDKIEREKMRFLVKQLFLHLLSPTEKSDNTFPAKAKKIQLT